MWAGFRRGAGAIALMLATPWPALAQETFRRVELGGTVAIGTVTAPGFRAPGFGAWIDVNLSRSLAIEARVLRLHEPFAGHSVTTSAGVRATLVNRRSFALYGLALPGVSSLWANHFVLDLGAGLVLAPRSRFVVRIEGNRDLHARRAGTTEIVSRWNLLVGASYRMGPPIATIPARATSRWLAGPQTGATVSTDGVWAGTAGAFAAYRLTSWCDVDTSVSGFLSNSVPPSLYEGGRLVQAVGGVKLGVRDGRFGVFFKARAGINRDSRVIAYTPQPAVHAVTMPVLDIGGIVEASLSARTVLRIDIGESLAFPRNPIPGFPVGAPKIYSLPVRIGLGWRF